MQFTPRQRNAAVQVQDGASVPSAGSTRRARTSWADAWSSHRGPPRSLTQEPGAGSLVDDPGRAHAEDSYRPLAPADRHS